MGIFDKFFPNKKNQNPAVDGYFSLLTGYTPSFTTHDGGVYEMELTRACIHSFASHVSKLLPTVTGADAKGIQKILDWKPNMLMTSAQFLYKVATIYEAQNTCFIIPILDKYERITGYYPVLASRVELVKVKGQPWLRYTFADGKKGAMELERCGVVSKFLYKNDFVGESNAAMNPTLQLMHLQDQGIEEGIKNSASFRFYATTSNFVKASDLKKEREKFTLDNLSADSGGGMLLFPNTYTNVTQITTTPQIVDPEQMKIINTRVFDYFGTNEDILQNKAVGDVWNAYYEGKIEPLAIQLSQTMTCMSYTNLELSHGNQITWSANRLQYLSTRDKLDMTTQMFDRGILSINMVNDIWNLPHVPDGDKRYIRREYAEINELENPLAPVQETEPTTPPPKSQENKGEKDDDTDG